MIKLLDLISERNLSAKEEKIVKALKKTGKFKKGDPAMYAIAASRAEALDKVGKEDADIDNDGDTDKTVLWFKARNPLLGDISPKEMIRLGRYERLRKFIINALIKRDRLQVQS